MIIHGTIIDKNKTGTINHTDGHTCKPKGIHMDMHSDRETYIQRHRETCRHTDRQTDRDT